MLAASGHLVFALVGTATVPAVHLLVGGDAAQLLEQLVARVSLEPGIGTVHWHSADERELPAALAVPETGPGGGTEVG